jgi:hypothetical protein
MLQARHTYHSFEQYAIPLQPEHTRRVQVAEVCLHEVSAFPHIDMLRSLCAWIAAICCSSDTKAGFGCPFLSILIMGVELCCAVCCYRACDEALVSLLSALRYAIWLYACQLSAAIYSCPAPCSLSIPFSFYSLLFLCSLLSLYTLCSLLFLCSLLSTLSLLSASGLCSVLSAFAFCFLLSALCFLLSAFCFLPAHPPACCLFSTHTTDARRQELE